MKMAYARIGLVVKVNDESAINPGGYGRIVRRSPKHKKVRVDSSEFPGQEVTGWYSIENIEAFMGTIPVSYDVGQDD